MSEKIVCLHRWVPWRKRKDAWICTLCGTGRFRCAAATGHSETRDV